MSFSVVLFACGSIIAASFVLGFLIEKLAWRRRYEITALAAAITTAVSVAHLLPLGRWTTLGYSFAVLATSCFVYAGWRLSRGLRHRRALKLREDDPFVDPNSWGAV